MKKTLIAAIVGMGAAVASYGQGYVQFATYNNGSFFGTPVTYANTGVPSGTAGLVVGNDFSAELYYQIGAGALTALPSTITAYFGSGAGDTANGGGYFQALNVATIPDYVSGAITFVIKAFNNTAIGSYGVGQIVGASQPFTMSSIATGTALPPDFSGTTLNGFTVAAVPEPSTLALAGLGGFGMLMALRRKKA